MKLMKFFLPNKLQTTSKSTRQVLTGRDGAGVLRAGKPGRQAGETVSGDGCFEEDA
ncbi:hypothetical protein KTH81_05810 [Lachnospiraceae bacterium ASD3451]|uniref:hypothetical protein n=1 Tax=Diplocloster agilis TaxID=2850323 RepID=UPI001D2AB200|nr:hypothetical protein [Diplocloster agilis]MBU9743336.1 hypothetical protein [Diplocloster agilis]